MVRKTTKRGANAQYVVTARITMKSGKLSKTAAEKLKRDTLKRAPNATVTVKKA